MGIFRRRAVLALTASAVTLSMLSACGGSDSDSGGDDSGPYQFYVLAPLSGPLAAAGEQVKAGVEAAVKVINANGGIDGRDVEVTVEDDAGDPTQVAGKLQTVLFGDDAPDLVLPGPTSTEALAGVPLTNQANVLAAGPAVSTELSQFDRYISGSPNSVDANQATLKAIADSGAQSIAILYQDNVSGASALDDFEANVDDYGLEITGVDKIAPDAVDATAQLERLRSKNPDVLLYSGYGPVVKPVLEGRVKIDWDVPLWSDQTAGAFNFVDLVSPEALEGYQVVVPTYIVTGSEQQQSEAIQTAIAAIEKEYGKDYDQPLQQAMHSYMAVMLVKYATEKAGSFDAKDVYEARVDLKLEDMPLYSGSTALFSDPDSNAPIFEGDDWTTTTVSKFEHGFIVP